MLDNACPEFQHAVGLTRKEYEMHHRANEASAQDQTRRAKNEKGDASLFCFWKWWVHHRRMNRHALELHLHLQRVFAGPTSNVETELNTSAGPWTRTTAAVRWEQVRVRDGRAIFPMLW